MRYFFLLAVLILATACTETDNKYYAIPGIEVSGELLFEGPNTLQGQPKINLNDIAEKLDISVENITAAYLEEATIGFMPDSLQANVESSLIQLVSDNLELVSVATKSPLPSNGEVELEVNKEQDILPYLKDGSTTIVVDANIVGDMDELKALVNLKLNIEYSK